MVETQQPAAVPGADFAAQVELLKAKNAELIGERRKDKEKFEALEARLTELQERSNKQRQAKLAESGEHKALWEEAQKTVAQREAELAELRAAMEQQSAKAVEQQVRATATAAMAQNGVFAPDQLYMLMAQKLKMNDGKVAAIDGGVEVPLTEFISNLKNPGLRLRALLLQFPCLRHGHQRWNAVSHGRDEQPLHLPQLHRNDSVGDGKPGTGATASS